MQGTYTFAVGTQEGEGRLCRVISRIGQGKRCGRDQQHRDIGHCEKLRMFLGSPQIDTNSSE